MSFAMNDTSRDTRSQSQGSSPFDALNKTLEALESRLDGIMASKSQRAPGTLTPSSTRVEPISVQETPAANLQNEAVAQIKERQRRLDAFRSKAAERREALVARPPVEPAAAAHMPQAGGAQMESLLDNFGRNLRDDMRRDLGEDVARHLGSLRGDLMQLKTLEQLESLPSELHAGLVSIEQKLSALSESDGGDALVELRAEVRSISAIVDGLAKDETVRGLDNRWSEICDLISEIDPATMRDEIAVMVKRLDEMQVLMNGLPDGGWTRQIGAEMRTIAGAVEMIAGQGSDMEGVGRELDRVNLRLDEISQAILTVSDKADMAIDNARLERIEALLADLGSQDEAVAGGIAAALTPHLALLADQIERLGEGGTDSEVMSRLDALSHQVAALSNGANQEPPQEVVRHLEHISEQIETLAVAQASVDFDRLEALVDRAEARLSDPLPVAGLESLHRQLDEITSRLDRNAETSAPASDDAMRSLEAQILSLSEHLSDRSGLAGLEPRLAAIETHMTHGRQDVIEAASRAAEQAVAAFLESGADEYEGSADDLTAVTGLAEDLRALEKLTRMSNDRSARAFDAVHDTLMKIAERLESLDRGLNVSREMPVAAAAFAAPAFAAHAAEPEIEAQEPLSAKAANVVKADQTALGKTVSTTAVMAAATASAASAEAQTPRSLIGRIADKVRPRRQPAEAEIVSSAELAASPSEVRETVEPTPPIDPSQQIDAGIANEPLEPGSGTPDLNRILQRVRDQQTSGSRVGNSVYSEDDRADFIAAARRAAQAAAADVENTGRKQLATKSDDKRTDGGSSSRRRPILIAVGAILLAVMSYPLIADMMGGDASQNDVPVAVQSVAPAETDSAAVSSGAETGSEAAPEIAAETVEPVQAPVAETPTIAEPSPGRTAGLSQQAFAPSTDDEAAMTTSSLDRDNSAPVTPSSLDTPSSDANAPAVTDEATAPTTEGPSADAPAEMTPETAAQTDPAERSARIAALPDGAGTAALLAAAEAGEGRALFEIASRYMEGRGVEESVDQAAQWYLDAARQGLAPAQYRIGNFYERGTGVERDPAEAARWYREAALGGNVSAMHNLAVLHASGGVDGNSDFDEAARWFAMAAEHGVSDSQFNLAVLYARGSGVEQDLGQSYKWFAIAADQGDADAANKRDEVANAMTPEALERARAEVELWEPQAVDPASNAVELPEEWGVSQTRTATIDMADAVRNIQRILNDRGFDAGSPDGVIGAKTTAAIRAFQEANELEPTGRIDAPLVEALLAQTDAG
ncbi:putative Hemaglutinin protein [Rhizobium sp. EC-SD404]|nr:putative Hemaglutinin protein [Rhizobium sp. EC-SD404]